MARQARWRPGLHTQRAGKGPVAEVGTAVPGVVCGPNRAGAPDRPLLKHTIICSVLCWAGDFVNTTGCYYIPLELRKI